MRNMNSFFGFFKGINLIEVARERDGVSESKSSTSSAAPFSLAAVSLVVPT